MAGLLDILAPVIAVIALGYGLARGGVITPAGETGIANLVFFATTPALLFRAMATTGLPTLPDLAVMAAYFGPCLLLYGGWALGRHRLFGSGLAAAGIGAMGASFGNTVLLGIPIVDRAYGPAGLRLLVLIVSIHSALLFSMTTLLAEAERGRADARATLAATARMMARNPIVLAIAAGMTCAAFGLRLPGALDAVLAMLGAATTPAALIAVGAGLAGFRLGGSLTESVAIVAAKMIVLPLAVWITATQVLALEPVAVAVATVAAAMPTGTNVYIIARRYDVSVSIAAGAILISTLLAAATLPLVIAGLR